MPVQIITATEMFISNPGGESVLFPAVFGGGSDRVYPTRLFSAEELVLEAVGLS